MLQDRPEMARYGESSLPLQEWAARKFAGEDLGRRIYWDPAEPPSFTFGENCLLAGERGAFIRVSSKLCCGEDKGNPQSFDELWSGAVFELHNILNAPDLHRIDDEARIGAIARGEYVERIWRCEMRSPKHAGFLHTRLSSLGEIEARTKPSVRMVSDVWDSGESSGLCRMAWSLRTSL